MRDAAAEVAKREMKVEEAEPAQDAAEEAGTKDDNGPGLAEDHEEGEEEEPKASDPAFECEAQDVE